MRTPRRDERLAAGVSYGASGEEVDHDRRTGNAGDLLRADVSALQDVVGSRHCQLNHHHHNAEKPNFVRGRLGEHGVEEHDAHTTHDPSDERDPDARTHGHLLELSAHERDRNDGHRCEERESGCRGEP